MRAEAEVELGMLLPVTLVIEALYLFIKLLIHPLFVVLIVTEITTVVTFFAFNGLIQVVDNDLSGSQPHWAMCIILFTLSHGKTLLAHLHG